MSLSEMNSLFDKAVLLAPRRRNLLEKTQQSRFGPHYYLIRVDGILAVDWSAWFDDIEITHSSDGTTTLSGAVVDDSALYGLISKVRDLGLRLLAIEYRHI